ncbi:class I SAM-dependent methyltransferase [Paenibacillus allorhizosphaerae]|uniref:2-methoxy-6-polyprenyl-1,4-benzoquinol methylase, mitochondrial n=1 Tax=Paenibacillus allorhizosphaerae TaxID=2849866 RepID=A0ABN7TLW4_9BACL|nr:class I SAM-dependent methyltransferase [Paenibacillus allorhizosphaerae]CAG7646219.1 2-methoxy-6-polyprenyl-1,4-benzoquinol methylase, mitochondrial [Paenibacillus allorhizosphaerae]
MGSFHLRYGLDAPRLMALQWGAGTVLLGLLFAVDMPWLWLKACIAAAGVISLLFGAWMLLYSAWIKLWHRRVVLEAAEVRSAQRVLDVGTGRGLLAIAAAQKGAQVTAIAHSSQAGASGKERQALLRNCELERTPNVRVMDGDAQRLPFADKSFEAVVSHAFLHSLPSADDRELSVLEMWRVLRPGGVLVLSDCRQTKPYEQIVSTLTEDVKIQSYRYTFPFSKNLIARKK